MSRVHARNRNREITTERALACVENAPNYDRDILVAHVRDALQDAYDDGKREGEVAARRDVLQLQLAMLQGLRQDIDNRIRTAEQEIGAIDEARRERLRGVVK